MTFVGALQWESVRRDFSFDGSWRDVCVREAGLDMWRAGIEALRAAGFVGRYQVGDTRADFPADVAAAFGSESGATFIVHAGTVELRCHFFTLDEIEFDLDPRDIKGQCELDALLHFMRVLAAEARADVFLTAENGHDRGYIRVTPAGECEHLTATPVAKSADSASHG